MEAGTRGAKDTWSGERGRERKGKEDGEGGCGGWGRDGEGRRKGRGIAYGETLEQSVSCMVTNSTSAVQHLMSISTDQDLGVWFQRCASPLVF